MTPTPEDRDPSMEANKRSPVFFSELCAAAVEGKSLDDALDDLGALILEATADKEAGYGPPQSELNAARRRWLAMFDQQKDVAA